jgi:hypothetical protein
MTDLLAQCHWPILEPPYDQALRDAVTFILQRFDVLGIIASGSIIRGEPHAGSDLDIYVVHARQQRQRIQKFFQGVPAEIFVNPVSAIEGYFENEAKDGRPCTAHMFVTGFVVLDRDPIVQSLQGKAQAFLNRSSDPSTAQLTRLRYGAADRYENACDIASTSSATANMILNLAIFEMLQYAFWKANRYLPRDKDLLEATKDLDPILAGLAQDFYTTAEIEKRLELAPQIADRTIEARGFFEWESPLEEVT